MVGYQFIYNGLSARCILTGQYTIYLGVSKPIMASVFTLSTSCRNGQMEEKESGLPIKHL